MAARALPWALAWAGASLRHRGGRHRAVAAARTLATAHHAAARTLATAHHAAARTLATAHHAAARTPLRSLKEFLPSELARDSDQEVCAPPPYLQAEFGTGEGRLAAAQQRVYIETYGCQMNFNDTEIVLAILEGSGRYVRASAVDQADVVLLMTCAIRENAEAKIWARLDALGGMEKRRRHQLTVGVLGCMAERLKEELLEKRRNVDIVCGPDAYRDLPRLLEGALDGIAGINVALSADETYADIAPVRIDASKRSAFVSIMRGCDNMCAYCIVPFTRGRERSRPIESIVEEVRQLSKEGIKEVTLLGQNVNSYCDQKAAPADASNPGEDHRADAGSHGATLSRGFRTIYKARTGGRRFVELIDRVSLVDPEMRIRFTSPHPKDFPDDLLYLMRDRQNICKQIHLPAQSGSTAMLEKMRRGYSREAYLQLVERVRSIIPNVAISSDFIVGFCDESASDHEETLSLLRSVSYDMAYMYAYSMREKTMAHRRYADNVPQGVKSERLAQVVDCFYTGLTAKVTRTIGQEELVLVEGCSKKSSDDLSGRSDSGRVVVFPKKALPDAGHSEEGGKGQQQQHCISPPRLPAIGDYVHVRIVRVVGATPIGEPIAIHSLTSFHNTRHQREQQRSAKATLADG